MDQHSREYVLRRIAACLRAHHLASDIQVIARAKVPIIKFVCPLGQFHVDISINQANGLQAAQFVNRWLVKQPAIRPLVMVLKQFLQQRALSEVFTGGLGSYSVTLLVLSFLQLHPKLQRGEMAAEQNLGVLLMELLELYGKNFGYDYCTIVVRGRGRYINKMDAKLYDERKPFLLSIQDPHDPCTYMPLTQPTISRVAPLLLSVCELPWVVPMIFCTRRSASARQIFTSFASANAFSARDKAKIPIHSSTQTMPITSCTSRPSTKSQKVCWALFWALRKK